MAEVVMPRLSDSMEEGTILQWLKKPGDEVAVGEELVEIETDKANMAYESDVAGTLTEILAEEGETLPIGTPIARVGDDGEGSGASAAGPDGGETPAGEGGAKDEGQGPAGEDVASFSDPAPRPPQASSGDSASADAGDRIKASPVARRIAKEKGLDLSTIQGSGPGGRIVKKDVKNAVASAGDAAGGAPRGAEAPPAPSTVGEPAVAGPADHGAGPSSISPETA